MSEMRAILSRLLAPLVASLAAWLMTKFGVVLDEETQLHLTEVGVWVLGTVWLILYGVVHKLIDRKVNPGDAAHPIITEVEKTEAESRSTAYKRV